MRYSSGQIWAIVAFASLVYLALGVVGVLSGANPLDVFWNLSSVVPVLVIGGVWFEGWGWRWQLLHRIRLVRTPVVIGTWRTAMESSWTNPETGAPIGPRTVYLVIEQTAISVSVRLLSDESSSELLHGLVTRRGSGQPLIAYTYRNEPAVALQRTRSRIHLGAAHIKIIGDPATALDGDYWTNRDTVGTLTSDEHSPHLAQTFAEALKLSYGPPKPVGIFGR